MSIKRSHYRRYLPVAAVIGVLTLGGCAGEITARGNLPDPERLAEVIPGEMTREEVAEILGSPSSVAAFDQETWLYISEKTSTFAFFEPEVIERMVVTVEFDDQGRVLKVSQHGMEEARDIEPVERTTPTAGNELSILDQVLGNFGKYNPDEQF